MKRPYVLAHGEGGSGDVLVAALLEQREQRLRQGHASADDRKVREELH